MRYFNRFIAILGLLSAPLAYAVDFYAGFLYWQPSETIDWALTNNLSLPNQVLSYNTIDFNFAPGLRVGVGLEKEALKSRLLYTWYHITEYDNVNGNVISAYMPSKFALPFYQYGEVNFKINFNTLDADLYKTVQIGEALQLNPLIGIKAAWINQSVNTFYQGQINVLEAVTNDFSGIGPKIGLESQWSLFHTDAFSYALLADFSAAFMWGRWSIQDNMTQSNSSQISSVIIPNRNLGAFETQGFLGLYVTYRDYSVKLGYEISDWFDQYQVFDNASGTHSNDLVLQGLTVLFRKKFL